MAKALVCYYSVTHNTERMAIRIAEVLRGQGLEVDLKKVGETAVDDLLRYDCLVFGSPTYYGTMAAEIKKLLDDSVKFHGKLEGKIGAAFSSSANIAGGNETTVLDILNAMLIHGMIIQGDSQGDHYGPVAIGSPDSRARNECVRLGVRTARLVKKISGE